MFYPFASTLNNEIMTVSFNEKVKKMDETIQDFAFFNTCRHRGNAE